MAACTSLEPSEPSSHPLKIAVEGCSHGYLDEIYGLLEQKCEARGWTLADLDLLIICGDFQAVRNGHDLNCMSVPRKYRRLGDFHRYYSGESKAPVLTLVIGGNHEVPNYFFELYHGGWLAPNIYYLGAASVVRYGPLRIAGLSGIYKPSDYRRPHYERLPYSRDDIRSAYHVREYDITKLLQVRSPIDIGISHDWPRRVEWYGDHQELFRKQPHFFESAKIDGFGNPAAEQVMNRLRPAHWFSGHMHTRFTAVVHHGDQQVEDIFKDLSISDDTTSQITESMFHNVTVTKKGLSKPLSPAITNKTTHFLALAKPGPGREFLEVMEIQPTVSTEEDESGQSHLKRSPGGKYTLHYDEEWLAITRAFDDALAMGGPGFIGSQRKSESACAKTISQNLDWVKKNITAQDLLAVPENFERHAPVHDPDDDSQPDEQPPEYPNSQTQRFYDLLQIPNRFILPSTGKVEGADHVVFE